MNDTPIKSSGEGRTSREDWLRLALDTLTSDGVQQVKVLNLAQKLGVSRSSFYWFFKSREDLLDHLLAHWEEVNTKGIIEQAERPAKTIGDAVLNVFECWTDSNRFDPRLDFAVREWARRSGRVRRVLDRADETRVLAIATMFQRYGLDEHYAFVRARILYFMQIGYYALELGETIEYRLHYAGTYAECFAGDKPTDEAMERFKEIARTSSSLS